MFCVRFHKQLLFDALRLDIRQPLDKRVEAAHEFHMILEHEHGFGKAQTMRERTACHNRAREQVFRTRHAFARCENFATRVHRMRGIHHHARFRGNR